MGRIDRYQIQEHPEGDTRSAIGFATLAEMSIGPVAYAVAETKPEDWPDDNVRVTIYGEDGEIRLPWGLAMGKKNVKSEGLAWLLRRYNLLAASAKTLAPDNSSVFDELDTGVHQVRGWGRGGRLWRCSANDLDAPGVTIMVDKIQVREPNR